MKLRWYIIIQPPGLCGVCYKGTTSTVALSSPLLPLKLAKDPGANELVAVRPLTGTSHYNGHLKLRPCLMCFCGVLPAAIIDSGATREFVTVSRVIPMSLNCKSLSESLSVRKDSSRPGGSAFGFFFKALVGEHRALSFLYGMAMILTLPCSPDVSIHAYSDPFH